MKCAIAPFFGSDIGDGFSEVPAMSIKILSIVLALPVGMIFGFSEDVGAILPRALAVTLRIFDADLNGMRIVRRNVSFRNGEAALTDLHLDAVIGDTQTDGEAKGLRQPISSRCRIGINEHRNYRAGWHRSVNSHLKTVTLNQEGRREMEW